MILRVNCKCGTQLKLTEDQADKVIKCPACAKKFRVPATRFVKTKPKSTAPTVSSADALTLTPHTRPVPVRKSVAAGCASAEPVLPDSLPEPLPVNLDDMLRAGLDGESLPQDDALVREFGLMAEPLPPAVPPGAEGKTPALGGPVCPACDRTLVPGAKICTQCGINISTGRSIMLSEDEHIDKAYTGMSQLLWWWSWANPIGVFPFASEGFGTTKPWVTRGIAILTIITSIWFWQYSEASPSNMRGAKTLLLWGGAEPDANYIMMMYNETPFGNQRAFERKLKKIAARDRAAAGVANGASRNDPSADEFEEYTDAQIIEAHRALPPRARAIGEFHLYQLLTNAFLHSDFFHLAGNLLFLIVFGGRVNALIGNVKTAIMYPLLAILASLGYLISIANDMPVPALGASGAIMGMAGLYFVLFPVHKMHMVAWIRWYIVVVLLPLFIISPTFLALFFRLDYKTFLIRGFWVVLFYIAFDVVATILGSDDGVAHWAHLSGFIIGIVFGIILLMARLVNARGSDLLSVVLGRRAWALIGKPRA